MLIKTKKELKSFREQCILSETGAEGGYVNDPADLGGETNHGITIAVANEFREQLVAQGWDGEMRNLSLDHAFWIYTQKFWKPMQLNTICVSYSSVLAQVMFRWGIKSGSSRPVSHLQRVLNVFNNKGKLYSNIVADGIIGKQTKNALDGLIAARGHDDAMTMVTWYLNTLQAYWMFKISEERADEVNERFTWGWACRCMREQHDTYVDSGIPKI